MPNTEFLYQNFADSYSHAAAAEEKKAPLPPVDPARLVQHTPLDGNVNADKISIPSVPVSDADAQLVSPTGFESWLPFAAKALKISADIKDYVFRPVAIFITDLPNRNGVGFPARELAAWSLEGGCQAYQTWRGKPMHIEHESDDPTSAIGVIVDVSMVPLVGFGQNKLWKVVCLAALDRTKDPERVGRIERGELNTYSMGAMVNTYTCSYCGKEVGDGPGFCEHIDPDEKVVFYELKGKLVYRLVSGVFAYELSSVEDPAYSVATADADHLKY